MSDTPDFQESMYERSIDVYKYQGKKNSTWMNLYAIFTGAFLVAFYSLFEKENGLLAKSEFFAFLILAMGLVTSICWLGTYHAYHSWLKSYVKTMQMHENKLFQPKGDEFKYFRLHTLGFSSNLKDGFFGGLSGEKINKFFISLVVLGWSFSLMFYAFSLGFEYFFFAAMFIIVLLFAFLIIFVLFMKSNGNKKIWMVNRQGEIENPENKWE